MSSGVVDPQLEVYTRGAEWGNFAMSFMNITCFAVAFLCQSWRRPPVAKWFHYACCIWAAAYRSSIHSSHDAGRSPWSVSVSRQGIDTLDALCAILSGALPSARIGVYMGVFNFFIVIPEIIPALQHSAPLIRGVLARQPAEPLYVVLVGGCFMLLAALLVSVCRERR